MKIQEFLVLKFCLNPERTQIAVLFDLRSLLSGAFAVEVGERKSGQQGRVDSRAEFDWIRGFGTETNSH